MHHTGGPGWRITMDSYEPMVLALYIRDVAGLAGAGIPSLSKLSPTIHPADHAHVTAPFGGVEALWEQWNAWWESLQRGYPTAQPLLVPPAFAEFDQLPALQCVLQAHFGAALTWTREHRKSYDEKVALRETLGGHKILGELVQNRELELGRHARDFNLSIVEMPLAEDRAWLTTNNRLIMSESLLDSPQTFTSFVQPVVEMLV